MRGHTYAQCIIYIYIYIVSVCICIIPFMDELRKKKPFILVTDQVTHFFSTRKTSLSVYQSQKEVHVFFQGKKIQPSVFLSTIYMIYT